MSKLADDILDDTPHRHLTLVGDRLWVLAWPLGLASYDLDLERYFDCRHPLYPPDTLRAIARLGPFADYGKVYDGLRAQGIELIHTPDEHLRADDLRVWYPRLTDLTPRSLWFDGPPDIARIGDELGWPVFVKGTRQTSGHRKKLSVATGPDELRSLLEAAQSDALLRSQTLVFREHVALRLLPSSVSSPHPDRLPGAFEFRSFWWHGQLVGLGPYWWQDEPYRLEPADRLAVVSLAREAALRMDVPFLVIDIAQTAAGRWIVVECNDAQESGHAGVPPVALWSAVLARSPAAPHDPPG